MNAEQVIDLSTSQPEKKLETVARVQDPVNAAPAPPQLSEQEVENGDDYTDESSDDGSEVGRIPVSVLNDELERAEFEPYTDEGEFDDYLSIFTICLFAFY